jgi:broad specificity phosphatase PhoE
MTTFLLIRHAAQPFFDKCHAGRAPGGFLDERGHHDAQKLAQRLDGSPIDCIYSSPRERTRETASAIAVRRSLELQEHAAIDEIEFGDWTGRTFDELQRDPEWPVWVEKRSVARVPNGETITAVQLRMVSAISALARAASNTTIALVTHGDVIKAAIAHYLRMSLDALERFDIAPASISILLVEGTWSRVALLNDTDGFTSS